MNFHITIFKKLNCIRRNTVGKLYYFGDAERTIIHAFREQRAENRKHRLELETASGKTNEV
jgi:hypothetical protein